MILLDVAAEDGHRPHPQTQCKKGLSHRVVDGAGHPGFAEPVKIGRQIETQPLPGSGQRQRPQRQHQQHGKEQRHHHLDRTFHAALQPAGAEHRGQQHHQQQIAPGGQRIADQVEEILIDQFRGLLRHQVAVEIAPGVGQQPAGDGGVEHHQQQISGEKHIAAPVPAEPTGRNRQFAVGADQILLRGPAEGQLHDQNREAEDRQKQQIQQHEHPAAALSGDERKPPDIAQADRTTGRQKDKSDPGTQILSGHDSTLS